MSTSGSELPESCPPQRKVMNAGSQRRQHRSPSHQRPHQLGGEYGLPRCLTAELLHTPWGDFNSAAAFTHNDTVPAQRNVMRASSVDSEGGGPITRVRALTDPTVSFDDPCAFSKLQK